MHSSGVSFPGTAFFSLSKQAAGSIESAEAQIFFGVSVKRVKLQKIL